MVGHMESPQVAVTDQAVDASSRNAPSVVEIRQGVLHWRPGTAPAPAVGVDALMRFVDRLHAPDGTLDAQKISRFARRYGALRVCSHGVPASHFLGDRELGLEPCRPEQGAGEFTGWFCEPLDVWRRLTAEARALLRIGQALEVSKPPPIDALEVFGLQMDRNSALVGTSNPYGFVDPAMDARTEVGYQRGVLAFRLDEWLRLGAVRPVPGVLVREVGRWLAEGGVRAATRWEPSVGLRRRVEGVGLMGGLALQLTAQLAQGGRVECAGCQELIEPKHRRASQGHWCEGCVSGGRRQREMDRRRRQRQREQASIARLSRGRRRSGPVTECQTNR